MAGTPYCNVDNLRDRLSAVGVSLRVDDSPPAVLGDVIDDASRTIDEYCLLAGYKPENLAVSLWVKHRCTDLAVMSLCERRGNPAPSSVCRRYNETKEKLEKVLAGRLFIPDIAVSTSAVPQLTNVRVQLHPEPHTRVRRSTSTGNPPSGYAQKVDRYDYLDYVIGLGPWLALSLGMM